uniref:Uncharacterized protein n=1 Tax=Physcomitrium patens TaxID=3218 RepID=A0A2K1IZ52_PHYPA|nr:hypothetical protein PHYPA_024370 [Physcomitrium patens]
MIPTALSRSHDPNNIGNASKCVSQHLLGCVEPLTCRFIVRTSIFICSNNNTFKFFFVWILLKAASARIHAGSSLVVRSLICFISRPR